MSDWDSSVWMIAAMAVPWIAVVTNFLFSRQPNVRESCTVAVAVVLTLMNLRLATDVFAGGRPELVAGEMLPGFELAFRIEPLGMMFALVASSLWILTTIYGAGYMRAHHEENQSRFFACFALAIFAATAAAFSSNLFTLFVAYEFMTISTYPLVTHHGDEEARGGGRVYLGILLSTSIGLFMMALIWTYAVADTLDFREGGILAEPFIDGDISALGLSVLLGLFAFGIGKAALMPVHRWLPAAMVAPTPVSALLHAVAVVKVGVFSILKISIYTFGIDLLSETDASVYLMYIAGFTIVVASLVALTKDNLKARLAYSTIGQLAYITLGAMLATQSGIMGGAMHIVMHAVGKITLFFCAGAIFVAAHKKNISDMRGLGYRMPWTFGAFLVASISIIGLPPGGGAWSKWFLAVSTVETEHYLLTLALMLSSLLNIAYLIPVSMIAFRPALKGDTASHDDGHHDHHTEGEAPLACVIPLCTTAVGSVLLFFFANPIYRAIEPITVPQSLIPADSDMLAIDTDITLPMIESSSGVIEP